MTIFSSAIGCTTADAKLYIILNVAIFIIGIIHIPIITTTPIIPTAFFKTTPQPSTLSTTSPNILPTTGITLETAALAVLAVIPSTLLLKVPSKDTTPTNIVKKIPKNHITPDFKNFAIFSICIFSETLEIIKNTTITKTIGIKTSAIIFPVKLQINNIIGSINVLVATFPVYTIKVSSNGISTFINPTKLLAVSLTNFIISVKFDIISVTINIY